MSVVTYLFYTIKNRKFNMNKVFFCGTKLKIWVSAKYFNIIKKFNRI